MNKFKYHSNLIWNSFTKIVKDSAIWHASFYLITSTLLFTLVPLTIMYLHSGVCTGKGYAESVGLILWLGVYVSIPIMLLFVATMANVYGDRLNERLNVSKRLQQFAYWVSKHHNTFNVINDICMWIIYTALACSIAYIIYGYTQDPCFFQDALEKYGN